MMKFTARVASSISILFILSVSVSHAAFLDDPIDRSFEVQPQSTLFETLLREGVSPSDIHEMVAVARPLRNLNIIRPGTRISVRTTPAPVEIFSGIKIELSPVESLNLWRDSQLQWEAQVHKEPVEITLVTYTGIVESSLWNSAIASQMDPRLIAELTEVFAWQVDFAREVRSGDRWKLTVEKRTSNGKMIDWGRIVAAQYKNGDRLYSAVYFDNENGTQGYFFPDGKSLKRMFLKSPIRFGRISSRFRKKRFHPILKINRPHLGVDYAAPRGTPIRAVGSGTVRYVGRRGGGGKTVTIRHNSTYKTSYKHLNGYASGIRRGARVQQGQVIGYVGSTGLATGPHLHFEFYENGRFVDPLGRKFPSAKPIPLADLDEFKAYSVRALSSLPPWYYTGVVVSGPVEISSESFERRPTSL